MKKLSVQLMMLGLALLLFLSGCAIGLDKDEPKSTKSQATQSTASSKTDATAKTNQPEPTTPLSESLPNTSTNQKGEPNFDFDAGIDKLEKLIGVADYWFIPSETPGVLGGIFTSDTSAMFMIHTYVYIDVGSAWFEGQKTVASAYSPVSLKSSAWDSAIFYVIDEFSAVAVALKGSDAFYTLFVYGGFPSWKGAELGAAIIEMMISVTSN